MRSFLIAAVLGAYASLTLAYPVSNSISSDAAEEQVLTPSGLRPKSQVHFVPPGGFLRHTANSLLLMDKDGKVLHEAPTISTPKRSALEARANGWVTYASWVNNAGSPIKSFTTSWVVPPAPSTDVGQTLFLFNSIEPGTYDAILQPVLQFGPSAAGGGSYWSVASWYVGPQTYYSSLVTVSPGQQLNGIISLTNQSGSSFNYDCSFTNVGGTSITLQNSSELVWATETLEVYNTQAASDYPTGSTAMTDINISTVSSSNPPVSWSISNDAADRLSTTVVTDGPVGGRVDIHYPS